VARLFRTTAEAERIHAEGHLVALGGVGDTAANLQEAIGGETYEFEQMYPPMLERAQAAGHKAARMFKYAVEAEAVHARLYQAALEAVRTGQGPGHGGLLPLSRVRPHRVRPARSALPHLRGEGRRLRAGVGRS
jgi:rubrerythrin